MFLGACGWHKIRARDGESSSSCSTLLSGSLSPWESLFLTSFTRSVFVRLSICFHMKSTYPGAGLFSSMQLASYSQLETIKILFAN